MISCPSCASTNLRNKGKFTISTGEAKLRFLCKDCRSPFSVFANVQQTDTLPEVIEEDSDGQIEKRILRNRRVIITSVKNGTPVDKDFLSALEVYAGEYECSILAVPTRHKNIGSSFDPEYDESILPYLYEKNLNFPDHKLKILGSLKISSAIENPLSGLDSISKGSSLIIGHPQIQLKTLGRVQEDYPAIVTTTGSVSKRNYTQSKQGTKADFNHSLSAVVVEFEKDFVHIRHLNYDEVAKGFNDLEYFYGADGSIQNQNAHVLVTGDEHILFSDKSVWAATYTNDDSLCNVLHPAMIVRHDVLDSYSISHHHQKDFLARYKKFKNGLCNVRDELELTIDGINKTTPSWATTYIVQSNHNEHLTRWLNECDPKIEPWNALIFHELMYKTLSRIDKGEHTDAFELYSREKLNKNVKFSDRRKGLEYKGIMLGSHGDAGTNGARGSRKQFSMLPVKSIIGHSHSPGIEKGCYQVGTSSEMDLEYNIGASSWHHTHCIVHKSGKRQLIFVTYGKFRL
jgi:hypothetical protein